MDTYSWAPITAVGTSRGSVVPSPISRVLLNPQQYAAAPVVMPHDVSRPAVTRAHSSPPETASGLASALLEVDAEALQAEMDKAAKDAEREKSQAKKAAALKKLPPVTGVKPARKAGKAAPAKTKPTAANAGAADAEGSTPADGAGEPEPVLGARVRIKEDLRGPNNKFRKISGREGELVGLSLGVWMFRADGGKDKARVERHEFVVLSAPDAGKKAPAKATKKTGAPAQPPLAGLEPPKRSKDIVTPNGGQIPSDAAWPFPTEHGAHKRSKTPAPTTAAASTISPQPAWPFPPAEKPQ